MLYSIVVPCYNEEKNIARLTKRFDGVAGKFPKDGFELILVDNGSRDGTSAEIDAAMAKYPYIRKVTVEVNQGYGYGILQGLRACRGEMLGWIHADLQLPPEAFLDMKAIIDRSPETADKSFFKGRRRNRPVVDTFFTFGMSCYESLLLHTHLYDINAQPTLMPAALFNSLQDPPYDFSFDLYMYYMAKKRGYSIIRVPVIQQEREEGSSSWNTGMSSRMKLVRRTLDFSARLAKEKKE